MHETMSSSTIPEVPPTAGSTPSQPGPHASAQPHTPRRRDEHSREYLAERDVAPGDIARVLRAVLGLPPDQHAPGELAAFVQPMPAVVHRVDAGGWIAWCMTGLAVFAHGEPPIITRVRTEARRLALSLAMLRSKGNITNAAQALGTSRKALRDGLRAAGLYPWPGVDGDGPRSDRLAAAPMSEPASVGKEGDGSEAGARCAVPNGA